MHTRGMHEEEHPSTVGGRLTSPIFTCYSVIGRVVCYSVVFTLFTILVFSYFSLVLLFPLSILAIQAKRGAFHQGPVLQSKFTMTKIVFSYLTSIKLTSVIR